MPAMATRPTREVTEHDAQEDDGSESSVDEELGHLWGLFRFRMSGLQRMA